jgi:predicted DNA-binding transcriptional regulator AlpA
VSEPQLDIMLSKKQVMKITGLSDSTLFRQEQQGVFPRRIAIAKGRVAWSQREIIAWLERVKADRPGLPPLPPNRMSRKMVHARAHAPRTKRLRFAA